MCLVPCRLNTHFSKLYSTRTRCVHSPQISGSSPAQVCSFAGPHTRSAFVPLLMDRHWRGITVFHGSSTRPALAKGVPSLCRCAARLYGRRGIRSEDRRHLDLTSERLRRWYLMHLAREEVVFLSPLTFSSLSLISRSFVTFVKLPTWTNSRLSYLRPCF
jgi:hypothetical protein